MKNYFLKRLGIFMFLFVVYSMKSQVGINTTAPNTNALLHISEVYNETKTIKGLIIPRVTTTERDHKWNLSANALGAADEGLTIYNTDEKCFNYYNSEENSWKSLCGSMGNAKFTMDCDTVSVNGNYIEGNSLNDSNYVLYTVVNVTKPGLYSMQTNTVNGYSFSAQGVFTSAGNTTIKLTGQGKPAAAAAADNFQVTSSGTTTNPVCDFSVAVKPAVSAYALNCSSVAVNGQYAKGQALNASNTITLSVSVSNPGSYSITTPETKGISFSASGTFSGTGSQQITLVGSGTPTVNSDFSLDINANTISGNASCSTTVPVVLPAMTYGMIGTNSVYSWSNIRQTALSNGANFGPNGIVKTLGLSQAWATDNATTAAANIINNPPDIILYFANAAPNSPQLITALTNYVKKGGVLIYSSTSNTDGLTTTRTLLTEIFNLPGSAVNWQTNCSANCPSSWPNDDNDYVINPLSNDPVVNGPFGNLAGKYWGEDDTTTGTIILSSLPGGSVQVASANNNWGHTNVNPDSSVVWYNNDYNFFMFGDSIGAAANNTDFGSYPSNFTSAGVPLSKQYGNGDNNGSPFVYASALELNAVAWAIKKAATAGINPH
ncbi:MAG: hypothetical protein MUW56_19025 [Chryseobacterium sp.]|uniref:hypothetical protein n=1 Tax=Chryseobacterium sp. TaxID=1871047 RepID=UPI0025B7CDF7|nr:hypothetical protein [Chryseobacterium sp.]MCJ7935656.1 hypothetical protein [Chryseobacterium sp.]